VYVTDVPPGLTSARKIFRLVTNTIVCLHVFKCNSKFSIIIKFLNSIYTTRDMSDLFTANSLVLMVQK
jgi:hypothetical protein